MQKIAKVDGKNDERQRPMEKITKICWVMLWNVHLPQSQQCVTTM